MSDLIDRQAAIDAIRAMQTYKLFAGDDMRLVDQAGAMTELMMLPPAQPEHRWIPCSERLPEEDQYNLVTMQHANGEIDVVIARLVKPYSQNVPWEWESDDAEWTWSFKNGFAWMPLPSPYQAERRTDGAD